MKNAIGGLVGISVAGWIAVGLFLAIMFGNANVTYWRLLKIVLLWPLMMFGVDVGE